MEVGVCSRDARGALPSIKTHSNFLYFLVIPGAEVQLSHEEKNLKLGDISKNGTPIISK
jgi:hypothetical protein